MLPVLLAYRWLMAEDMAAGVANLRAMRSDVERMLRDNVSVSMTVYRTGERPHDKDLRRVG